MDKTFEENFFHNFRIKLKIILLICEKFKKNKLLLSINYYNFEFKP